MTILTATTTMRSKDTAARILSKRIVDGKRGGDGKKTAIRHQYYLRRAGGLTMQNAEMRSA